ncbi:MAG TPA: glycosyltransferase family 1 protein [Actinomycetota bacterium]|nr:glycosyltransferase family 1 protein [Actinomycetota bacterium]
MRVLLDATSLPALRLGAGQYVAELARALDRRGDLALSILAKDSDERAVREIAPGADIRTTRVRSRPARLAWEQAVLPLRAGRMRPHVLHGPHYSLPMAWKGRSVVTFHDPTFFTHPHLHERAKVLWFRRMARTGLRRATVILAVSDYARAGAIDRLGAHPDRIRTVHLGVDHSLYCPQKGASDESLRAAAGVSGPYVLWVGAQEPRKDVPSLIAAWTRLREQGLEHRLVLAGPRAWGAAAIDQAVAASPGARHVHRPGYVTEVQKIALYRGAAVFVYPSIAEGFGLPVLEAMACGAPVVTTSGSATSEVGGDAVVAVTAQDSEALASGIERALRDAPRLSQAGPVRARQFSWDRTAEQTVEAYRAAAGEHGG